MGQDGRQTVTNVWVFRHPNGHHCDAKPADGKLLANRRIAGNHSKKMFGVAIFLSRFSFQTPHRCSYKRVSSSGATELPDAWI
jgi:hypothetical protein